MVPAHGDCHAPPAGEPKAVSMTERYLDFQALSTKLAGRSRSSIDRDVKAGRLPKPLKLGQRVYWLESLVDEHLARMMESQRPETVP